MMKSERNRWHAVSIVPTKTCREALAVPKGKRFLSQEAPRLPLTGCSQSGQCACVYRHHDDRRAGPRRAVEKGWQPSGRQDPRAADQRQGRGRRATD